jgi:acetyl-CoA carboxylase biotin carboxylase subunit
MKRALNEFGLDGVSTTIPFHLKVLEHEKFLRGDFDIKFLEEHNVWES